MMSHSNHLAHRDQCVELSPIFLQVCWWLKESRSSKPCSKNHQMHGCEF